MAAIDASELAIARALLLTATGDPAAARAQVVRELARAASRGDYGFVERYEGLCTALSAEMASSGR